MQALRAVGVEAHYAYVGGYKLEQRLRGVTFAHTLIEKAQNPFSFRASAAALRSFIDEHSIDVVHAHLTWDHWLAWFAARKAASPPLLARTFHSRRALRSDPLTRLLLRRTDLVATVNAAMADSSLIRNRHTVFTPPPLDETFFRPEGPGARDRYGIPAGIPVVMAIGKLSPLRGFEDVLRSFALLNGLAPARLLIIGHGPHRPKLEELASALGISKAVTWAGYHEDDLPEHYRAADLMLFTAKGSDEGHRAIIEAMACGVPVISYPIEGVGAIYGELGGRLISAEGTPESLATSALPVLVERSQSLPNQCAEVMRSFHLQSSGKRLIRAYQRFLSQPRR